MQAPNKPEHRGAPLATWKVWSQREVHLTLKKKKNKNKQKKMLLSNLGPQFVPLVRLSHPSSISQLKTPNYKCKAGIVATFGRRIRKASETLVFIYVLT